MTRAATSCPLAKTFTTLSPGCAKSKDRAAVSQREGRDEERAIGSARVAGIRS